MLGFKVLGRWKLMFLLGFRPPEKSKYPSIGILDLTYHSLSGLRDLKP